MQDAFLKNRIIAVFGAVVMLIALCFVMPCRTYAADDDASLMERSVWFTYACTDCLGETFRLEKEQIGYYAYPSYFGLDMMLCDTDHVVHVEGDGVTAANVTLTSLNPGVLEIDSDGHVTLHKTGRAEIKATVAADSTYKECTVSLGVNVGRHDGWIGTEQVCFAGHSPVWGLELDTSEGPQQLVVPLRPGANVSSYFIDDPKIATVDQNGVVTPVSPGYATIRFYVDDGGGKYKAGYFEEGITITGESTQGSQGTSGGNITAEEEVARIAAEEAARKVEEEAARKAAEEVALKAATGTARNVEAQASQKAANARSKALKRPGLRVKALKGKKIKLKWSRVANADGYIIYVKYPGRKKYVKATVRNATVKAVTHRGLSRGKVYRYKVRAYKKVKGKIRYSPFSKVRKARVR